MHIPRPLIVAGMLAAGGALGWAINACSDEAGEFLLAASGSADQPVSQPVGTQAGETVVRGDDDVPLSTEVPLHAEGDHIVIAHDRAVVFIGDDGQLNANVGDVSSSGVLAIDAQGSTLETGDAKISPVQAGEAITPLGQPLAGSGTAAAAAGWSAPGASVGDRAPGQATSISGWEDHSLFVHGSGHVVTYDDSNVFIDRDGQLNINTGDTDSSGLNVVDATRSRVVTGNHIEDGDEDGEAVAPSPTTPAASASVADDGDSVATGRDAFVVGADGIDDLAVDVFGRRNVVTYDDSNVAVGGTGDVNAQIGDSDTSGAVVMGVTDSAIASGNST